MLKKLINILNDYIYIYIITPLNNINENDNNKSDFTCGATLKYYWYCVKSNRRTDINKVCEAVDNGICGYAIITGKYYDIFVVDVKNTSNPDFIYKLHSTNTLAFKTPSGGFHFIYSYTEDLCTKIGILVTLIFFLM